MVDAGKHSPRRKKYWFQRLDRWDLDDALQNLKEDGLPLQQCVSVKPAKPPAGKATHTHTPVASYSEQLRGVSFMGVYLFNNVHY